MSTTYVVTGRDTGVPLLDYTGVLNGLNIGDMFTTTLSGGLEAKMIGAGLIAKAPIPAHLDGVNIALLGGSTGDVLTQQADGSFKPAPSSGGSGNQAAAQILQITGTKTFTDLTPSSAGMYYTATDLSVTFQRGSDLSLVANAGGSPADAGALASAAGGDFAIHIYLGLYLTPDVGSTVQRLMQFYTSSLSVQGYDLGSDLIVPLVPTVQVDTSVFSMPYFDVTAGEPFGWTFFGGAQGSATDSVHANMIMTAWSL